MGGRGTYSYSGGNRAPSRAPLSQYAVASINGGTARGTTTEAAIGRFRNQLMDAKVEYSAYIDDYGYVHALGSTDREGSTSVAPLSAIANETGVRTIIHNHPHGTSDGRKWGGPFSEGDMSYIANAYSLTNGRINRIVATSNEGTYSAVVRRPVSQSAVRAAAAKADAFVRGKTYQSEIAMWRAVNEAYAGEFGKIGIDITFAKQRVGRDRLVTQKTGTY